MKTFLIYLSLFYLSFSVKGQININIQTNRTSGVAPLYVFFNVTTTSGLTDNDYLNANFSWDFDDPTGDFNNTRGFVCGHVFETPGEYNVEVTGTDNAGNSASKTITITVTEFSGTTYYVATNGDDNNPGSIDAPFQTVSKAMSLLGSNVRVLLRRGDAFDITYFLYSNLVGPVIIGAYGEGDAPVLNTSGNHWGAFSFNNTSNDIRLMDLHIVGLSHDRNDPDNNKLTGGISIGGGATNILVLNMEIENVARGGCGLSAVNSGVFNCNFHEFASYGSYSESGSGISFVGNKSRNQDGNEHFYRTQGGNGQFIAYNDFAKPNHVKSSIQIRGNGTTNVVVLGNKLELTMGAHPQNDGEEEYVSNVLFESNTIWDGIPIVAKNVVLRNNLVIDGIISLDDHPLVGISDNVDIYNNSIYSNTTYAFLGQATDVTVYNNIFHTTTTEGYASAVYFRNNEINQYKIDYNIYYAPNKTKELWFVIGDNTYTTFADWKNSTGFDQHSIYQNPLFLSLDSLSGDFLRLSETSPGIDNGKSPAAITDFNGHIRTDGKTDIGAFEFGDVPGLSNPSLKTNLGIIVYPNPLNLSQGILYYESQSREKIAITLYSLEGKSELYRVENSPNGEIDLQGFEKGIYLLKLAKEGEIEFKKLVIY